MSQNRSLVAFLVVVGLDQFIEPTMNGVHTESPALDSGSEVDDATQLWSFLLEVGEPPLDTSHSMGL